MYFRFEKLRVWQEGREFVVRIYKIASKFPTHERFCLSDQIRRAAISVVLNIAEGSDKKSDKEFAKFLRISIGSIEEVVTGLYIALDLKYISTKEFRVLYEEASKLSSKINALINSFKKQ